MRESLNDLKGDYKNHTTREHAKTTTGNGNTNFN